MFGITNDYLEKQEIGMKRGMNIIKHLRSIESTAGGVVRENPKAMELATEIIEMISKKEDLAYKDVYQALEMSYAVVDAQSSFTGFKPININSILLEIKKS